MARRHVPTSRPTSPRRVSSAARSPRSSDTARDIGRRIGVPVAAVRLGSVLGPHVPSPLGRLLRMPFVPFSVLADPPFAVVEDVECAMAFVAAAERRLDEPVNVLANGAITALQAIRRGGRIPVPLVGPDWRVAKVVSGLAGAPIPDHVLETLHRGRLADNGRMSELVGFSSVVTTVEVIDKLYAWPSVDSPAGNAAGGLMGDVVELPRRRLPTPVAALQSLSRSAIESPCWRRGTSTTGVATTRSCASPTGSPRCAGRRPPAGSSSCRRRVRR